VEFEKISSALGDCDQPCPGRWLQIITSPTVDAGVGKGGKWERGSGSIFHHVCCKLACITYRQQIDQVEFEHYPSNML